MDLEEKIYEALAAPMRKIVREDFHYEDDGGEMLGNIFLRVVEKFIDLSKKYIPNVQEDQDGNVIWVNPEPPAPSLSPVQLEALEIAELITAESGFVPTSFGLIKGISVAQILCKGMDEPEITDAQYRMYIKAKNNSN